MNFGSRMRSSAYAFPVALAIAVTLLAFSESSYRRSRESMDELNAVTVARARMQRLLLLVTDAETSQRGYLLTNRKEYLEPYRNALESIPPLLARLKAHYATRDSLGAQMARLDELTARKLSELDATLGLHDTGQEGAWRELLLSNIGKEQMDTIRAAAEQVLAADAARVAQARQDVDVALMQNRLGIVLMTVLCLLALRLYLRQRDAAEAQNRVHLENARDLLQSQVEQRTRELSELAGHLQTAREDERQRLAHELHDELGALLTAAKLDTARIKTRVAAVSPEASERLAHLNETLNSVIALKRRIIEDLRPSTLSNLGLVPALTILARDFATRAELKVECALEPVALTPQSELTVFRLVQEALTNIGKYARASQVRVSMTSRDGRAQVAVTDDGVGFDAGRRKLGSHGLLGMRYRVESEGGRLEVRSAPGAGTQLSATLPLAAAP
jgi:signal transduction histidine kinase